MVELVTEDRPDIVCLQEVPVWALKRLAGWSGMQAIGVRTVLARTIMDLGGLAPPETLETRTTVLSSPIWFKRMSAPT